jgi:cell division protein FtsW
VLLLSVFLLDRSHATHRWIRVGPLSLQPPELAKLAVIVFIAWFLESRRASQSAKNINSFDTLAPVIGTVLMVVGLIVVEPDLGTACMIMRA